MTTEVAHQWVITAFILATPLLLAALGEIIGEKGGMLNIGLEGMMLVGAWSAAAGSFYYQSAGAGVLAAILSGVIVSSVFAVSVVLLQADAIVTGTGINLLALGLTGVAQRRMCELFPDYQSVRLPVSAFAILGLLVATSLYFFLQKTRGGLKLRAVGDLPAAAESSGVNVLSTRFWATVTNGGLCGLAGAFLSMAHTGSFAENMTGGRGFTALAIVIFGRWNPLGAVGAALLFGAADGAQFSLQAMAQSGYAPIFSMLPYVLTLVTMAGFAGRTRPPAALGTTYER